MSQDNKNLVFSEELLSYFAELVEERLANDLFMTEDTLRYLFMSAVIEKYKFVDNHIAKQNHITLEKPFFSKQEDCEKIRQEAEKSGIRISEEEFKKKAKLDMLVEDANCNHIIEFKYFRQGKRNLATPYCAGQLLLDFERVVAFNNMEDSKQKSIYRYAIMLSDSVMHKYFTNGNGFESIYEDISSFAPTDLQVAETSRIEINKIACVTTDVKPETKLEVRQVKFSKALENALGNHEDKDKHYLRIFLINKAPAK